MHVWYLAKPEFKKGDAFKRFRHEAQELGVQIDFATPEALDLFIGVDGPRITLHGKKVVLPDVVLPRLGAGAGYFALAALRQIEQIGVPVISSPDAIELAKDKLASMQCLAAAGLPVPKTMLARLPLDLKRVRREFKFPIIIKTISGSQGKGVFLCRDEQMLDDIVSLIGQSVPHPENLNLILQEYISQKPGQDIRVFLVGGRPLGAMLRSSHDGSYKANVSRGGSATAYELTPEIEWLAAEAARIVGLEIAGVDLLFDGDSYKICEVNSSPGFKGFEPATGVNVPAEILKYLRVRVGSTR